MGGGTLTATVVWIGIWCLGALSLALGVAAVVAWRRERHLPVLQRQDAHFGLGMGSFTAGLVFLMAAVAAAAVQSSRRQHAAFMEDCVQHRPRYECTALWRAGNRDDPAIVPLLIPIPMR